MYDRSGFGSKATTLQDARDKDKRNTQEDVEELSREHFEVKRKPRGENSFVRPHVHFNYQVYLYFTSKIDRQQEKLTIGLALTDIFGQDSTVIPTKSKE